MFERIRLGGEWTTKKIVAAVLFGAIIITFVAVGPRTANMGDATGSGVAALVNDQIISVAEFRQRVEQAEQTYKQRMAALPEAQRKMITAQLRQSELERLIGIEAIFQEAEKQGVSAADAEVKSMILQMPQLGESGRFLPERYRLFLQYNNMSAENFERGVRKQLVIQKVVQLFRGAAKPARLEAENTRRLSGEKLSARFAVLSPDDVKRMGLVSAADIAAYLKSNAKDVETYYKENLIEFTEPERYHAHDLAIRIDEKRSDADALKKTLELRKGLNVENFGKLARESSEDPGAKIKGGDLGLQSTGHLEPTFEASVLKLKAGAISEPIKAAGAYHLVWLEEKKGGGTTPFAEAQTEAARRVLGRTKEGEITDALRKMVRAGDRKQIESLMAKAKVKWQETGEFSLAQASIPKLEDSRTVLPLLLKQGRKGGLVNELIDAQGNHIVAELLSWKTVPVAASLADDTQMTEYRRSGPILEAWAQGVEAKANIHRNSQLLKP